MIQDIQPHIFSNRYVEKQPQMQDSVLVFAENKILLKRTAGQQFQQPQAQALTAHPVYALPTRAEADDILSTCGQAADMQNFQPPYQYLFCIDRQDFFLARQYALTEERMSAGLGADYQIQPVSKVRESFNRELCFVIYTAYHLYVWYRENQYCGRCGTPLSLDHDQRMLRCAACGSQIFPRIAPAVIVAVTDGDRIVLTRYAGRDYKKYALIAGFVEIGETAEETVRREVMEEVGLRVKNIRYYKTQPWGIAGDLLIGYFAELDGDDTIRMDENELAAACWVDRRELRDMDDGISLTREMMRQFYEGMEV